MRLRELFSRRHRSASHSRPDREPDQRTAAVGEHEVAPTVGDSPVLDDPGELRSTSHVADPEAGRERLGPAPAVEVEDPRWTRAVELRDEFNRAMTLENTPAAFVSEEYDYSDHVWCDQLYSTPGSVHLEQELDAHVRAHPDLFTGTEFEQFALLEDEHGEDHDRPPELEDQEPDDDPRPPTAEAAPWREMLDDDEFDAPF